MHDQTVVLLYHVSVSISVHMLETIRRKHMFIIAVDDIHLVCKNIFSFISYRQPQSKPSFYQKSTKNIKLKQHLSE
jgi:hypothetical protein